MLIGHLVIGAPAGHANVSQPRGAVPAEASTYPPYPPTDCFRHYQRPARHGWKIELVWWGGRSCPRVFFRPARAEIWMYEGSAAPLAGPWTKDRSAQPKALYGGHLAPADRGTKADDQRPSAVWWEKVKEVPVEEDGSWSADIYVDEPGPYTFAAVNSLSREYVLIEVDVWNEHPTNPGGNAGGAGMEPAAGAAADPESGDTLLRVGVPTASSAFVMGAALILLRRLRRKRQV